MPKPILILQLRPEDDTSDGEFAAILKYGGLDARTLGGCASSTPASRRI